MKHQRGAILVEFALVAVVIFSVLFGTIQLGVVGLEQIKADGAAFTGSHQQALAVASDPKTLVSSIAPKTLVSSIYPGVAAGDLTFQSQKSLTVAEEPVDYQLDQTASRHGGFSVMLPIQTIGTVVRSNVDNIVLGLTGSTISLSGTAVEPAYEEIGAHSDINAAAINSDAAFTGSNNYFTQGENTPPYFVGFKYMHVCMTASNCNVLQFDALGLAEYLDVDNWSRTTNGVTRGAVFSDMLMHQNVYSEIAQDLVAANMSGGVVPTANIHLDALGAYLNPTFGDSKIRCLYTKWDSQTAGGYGVGGTQIGDFPLNPGAACS